MSQNEANCKAAPVKCTCGKWYATVQGATMCQANRHGSGKQDWNSRFNFEAAVDFSLGAACSDCGENLSFEKVERGSAVVLLVLPHVCQVDEPEVLEVAA